MKTQSNTMREVIDSMAIADLCDTWKEMQNFAKTGWYEETGKVRQILADNEIRAMQTDISCFYNFLCERLAKEFVER